MALFISEEFRAIDNYNAAIVVDFEPAFEKLGLTEDRLKLLAKRYNYVHLVGTFVDFERKKVVIEEIEKDGKAYSRISNIVTGFSPSGALVDIESMLFFN